MKKSMFFMAIVAISMFLTSCADRTVSVPTTTQTSKEVEVNVLYEPGAQINPEHHSKHQVTGVNCAGKQITYNRYEDDGSICPKTEIGKAHYFMKTNVEENQNQQVVVTNFWSGFDANTILPLALIIGLILLFAYLWNNRDRSHTHRHEHHYPVNSNPNARSDFHNHAGCHQNNDNANGWINSVLPPSNQNVKSEKFTFEREYFERQTGGGH